jgi:hypothetical protein
MVVLFVDFHASFFSSTFLCFSVTVDGVTTVTTLECPEMVSTVELGGGAYADRSIKPKSGCLEVDGLSVVVVCKLLTANQDER